MNTSVYYVVNTIADGIADVLYKTLYRGDWMNWKRPLTTPWFYHQPKLMRS